MDYTQVGRRKHWDSVQVYFVHGSERGKWRYYPESIGFRMIQRLHDSDSDEYVEYGRDDMWDGIAGYHVAEGNTYIEYTERQFSSMRDSSMEKRVQTRMKHIMRSFRKGNMN
jgi:hypothetical protein